MNLTLQRAIRLNQSYKIFVQTIGPRWFTCMHYIHICVITHIMSSKKMIERVQATRLTHIVPAPTTEIAPSPRDHTADLGALNKTLQYTTRHKGLVSVHSCSDGKNRRKLFAFIISIFMSKDSLCYIITAI